MSIGFIGVYHILREASALSVQRRWAFQSLRVWDGQQVRLSRFFFLLNAKEGALRHTNTHRSEKNNYFGCHRYDSRFF